MIIVDWKHDSLRIASPLGTRVEFCEARLDNRVELASSLSLSPDVSDIELILSAYNRYGTKCPQHLYGDFAFALWDSSKRCVFAARDIMGCQPVYYSASNRRFAIAESTESLLATPGVARDPDKSFIAASLNGGFAHQERTYFQHIRKIPPGHFIVAVEDSISVESYWRPEDIRERKWASHKDCLEEFRDLLNRAVSDRLPQNGRTGVHVSGGLDCSSLAILAANQLQKRNQRPPVALSWYPPPNAKNTDFERSEYARIESVCDAANVQPVYTIQSKQNILDVLNRDHMVRPICNATYNEQLVLSEASQRGVTTILSGFGGDEAASFNGRGYFQRLALTGRWLQLSKLSSDRGVAKVRFCARHFFTGMQNLLMSDSMLKEYEDCVFGMDVSKWKGLFRAFMAPLGISSLMPVPAVQNTLLSETRPYLRPSFADSVAPLPPIPRVRLTNDRVTRCDLYRWSPITARLESWATDGARHGIRYTYPLMDRRIVEFALSLPGHVFRNKDWNRLFFRQAMEPILPPNVCWEKSKDDPARFTPLLASLQDSLSEIGLQLKQNGTNSPKADYLDLDRLISDLSEKSLQGRKRFGRLICAMEFLGTEPRDEHRIAA